jgi:Tat protein translocase TatB subunit
MGLGITEILLILVVALLVLGPDRLPEVAKTLGKTLAEFRRTLDEVKREVNLSSIETPPNRSQNISSESQSKTSQPTLKATELGNTEQEKKVIAEDDLMKNEEALDRVSSENKES